MHQRLAACQLHERELGVRNILPMLFTPPHSVVVRKAAKRKYLIAINQNRRRGVLVGINTHLSKLRPTETYPLRQLE
jgi:hypothetical protein